MAARPVLLMLLAAACLVAPEPPTALPVTPAPLLSVPALIRVAPDPGAFVEVDLPLTVTAAMTLLAAEVDCSCLVVLTPLPLALMPGRAAALRLRVAGVLPGMHSVRLATTGAPAQVEVQVIGEGLGQGGDLLDTLLAEARLARCTAWFVIHDLRGQVRNCGCSAGSLGGIDHLAALPAACRTRGPDVATRFVLSGEVEVAEVRSATDERGSATRASTGITAALAPYGWATDARIVVADQVDAHLDAPGVVAVIPRGGEAPNHARVVVPLASGGMVAEVLLVDAAGVIRGRRRLPIDATLPAEPAILAHFAEPPTLRLDAAADPSASCRDCHAADHASWSLSRHARAWQSLKPADHGESCARCHTTALPAVAPAPPRLAPGVHCQACHTGADAHATARRRGDPLPTTGANDCRTCHDAKHHPGFDRAQAWSVMVHGAR